jgi:hypothetical protein
MTSGRGIEFGIADEARAPRLVEEAKEDGRLASAIVQVAEFEPPRFAVGVDAGEKGAGIGPWSAGDTCSVRRWTERW